MGFWVLRAGFRISKHVVAEEAGGGIATVAAAGLLTVVAVAAAGGGSHDLMFVTQLKTLLKVGVHVDEH